MTHSPIAPTTRSSPEKTTIELEPDIRKYLERRSKTEGRTLKWLVNSVVREEMLAGQSLATQPDLIWERA